MADFVLVCGLPRSGTREITDIFNGVPGVCIQGEITGANFKHACDFINNIIISTEGINRDRLVRKGAELFSDALGLAGKARLLKTNQPSTLVGFKCPNSQNWYKEILEVAKLLNFKVHVIMCVRNPNEVYRSLTQMEWYRGGYERFEKMCLRLIRTYNEILDCEDSTLASTQVFNLNAYLADHDPVEYIQQLAATCGIDCNQKDIAEAVGAARNRNATERKKSRKKVDNEELIKNKENLQKLAKNLSAVK